MTNLRFDIIDQRRVNHNFKYFGYRHFKWTLIVLDWCLSQEAADIRLSLLRRNVTGSDWMYTDEGKATMLRAMAWAYRHLPKKTYNNLTDGQRRVVDGMFDPYKLGIKCVVKKTQSASTKKTA